MGRTRLLQYYTTIVKFKFDQVKRNNIEIVWSFTLADLRRKHKPIAPQLLLLTVSCRYIGNTSAVQIHSDPTACKIVSLLEVPENYLLTRSRKEGGTCEKRDLHDAEREREVISARIHRSIGVAGVASGMQSASYSLSFSAPRALARGGFAR